MISEHNPDSLTPDIISALNTYSPIPLYKMSKVGLMNRVDIKYVFPSGKLPSIMRSLSNMYQIMDIDDLRFFPYKTIYLDYSDKSFYHQHLTGKYDRYKIRFREYMLSGVSYLEIKKKSNKGRTIKNRIVNIYDPVSFDDSAYSFVRKCTPYDLSGLEPSLITGFSRITLVNLPENERITFDYNLSFSDFDNKKVEIPSLAIAELKKESYSMQSRFCCLMKRIGIRPAGFSKYCVGQAILHNAPRQNLLKPKLLLINKISNEYNRSYNI